MFWIIFTFSLLLFTYLGKDHIFDNKLFTYISRLLLVIVLSYVVAYSAHNYVDNDAYITFYESLGNSELSLKNINFNIFSERSYQFEIGFHLLSTIIHKMGMSNVGYLFTIAFFTNCLLVSFIYRFKCPIFIIVTFITSGLYFQECNLVRQMLAIAIFCYSLKFINGNNRRNYYALCIICAALFHTSAILLLVFMLIPSLNTEQNFSQYNKYLFILWCISIIISLGLININLSTINFLSYYQGYVSNVNSVGVGELRLYSLLYNLCIFLYYLFTDKYKVKNNFVYIIIFILGGILTNISVIIPNLYRFSLYFTMMQIVIMPSIINVNFKVKYSNLSKISFLLLFIYYSSRIFVRIITNDNPFL